MGQMAVGVLYGCEAPELPDDENGEAVYDLIMRWEKAKSIPHYHDGLKIRVEHEGGRPLLGVWVAVGGSGEDGAPYFVEERLPLDQFARAYRDSIAKAKKLWDRFAAYAAKKEQITLPAATLWLTPCEVA